MSEYSWNENVVNNYKQLLKDLTQNSNQSTDNFDNIKICDFHNATPLPQQGNGHDCGVFICMYMHELLLSKSIHLQQKNVPFFREYMCSCMLLGRINVKSHEKFIHDITNVDDAESDDNSVESVES